MKKIIPAGILFLASSQVLAMGKANQPDGIYIVMHMESRYFILDKVSSDYSCTLGSSTSR